MQVHWCSLTRTAAAEDSHLHPISNQLQCAALTHTTLSSVAFLLLCPSLCGCPILLCLLFLFLFFLLLLYLTDRWICCYLAGFISPRAFIVAIVAIGRRIEYEIGE